MIKVNFTVDPGTDYYVWLDISRKSMPWLDYLYKNSRDLIIHDYFKPDSYQNVIEYCFELSPEKETFYRMKYGNGL